MKKVFSAVLAAGALLAPAMSGPGEPDAGLAATAPAMALSSPAATDSPSNAVDVPLPVVPPGLAPVDYGPVMPTPVVDLMALQQQAAASQPRSLTQGAPKSARTPTQKSAVTTASPASSTASAKPVKKRLCWTKGVVAPCR